VATVAPALLALKSQVDAAYPLRSKASDGGLPSAAHHAQNPNSDHETGDAWDFTYDEGHGPDLDALAVALLRDPRTHYVIWNRQIANPEIQGGAWRAYSGASPHTEHLHLSIYDARRDDASPWDIGQGGAPAQAVPAAAVPMPVPSPAAQFPPAGATGPCWRCWLGLAAALTLLGGAAWLATFPGAPEAAT
jgi:hypothetical protein